METGAKGPNPRGFETNRIFSDLPVDPRVRFDPVKQVLHDDNAPGYYIVNSSVRDERAQYTLRTLEHELVAELLVQYRLTNNEHLARVYYVWDAPQLSAAGYKVREGLTLKSFASALAALPRLLRSPRPYKIFYEPLAPGEIP